MFSKNKELQRAVDKLYENIKDCKYGEKFSWGVLKELSGNEKLKKQELYYVVNSACLLLMQNDMKYLQSIHGFGKYIIEPREHNIVAKKKAKKSVKIYRTAGQVLASTNLELLTEDQKREVVDSANKYSTLEMFSQEMLKKRKLSSAKKEDILNASFFLDAIQLFSKNKE